MGKINSVMASQIDERKIPLVIQAVLLFILAKDSIRVDVLEELHYFFVGGLISTVVSFALLFVNEIEFAFGWNKFADRICNRFKH